MKRTLSFSSNLAVGSLLFGLFFGAGNLIFPVYMGQLSGQAVFIATAGFIMTAVGLPFLGIVAMGLSRSDGLFDLSSRVHPYYAYGFTILLYLTIGPFFALPRLGNVSFEIGVSSYIPEQYKTVVLAIFTICFFGAALFFAMRPSKILTWVGKVLNPLFLVFLSILVIASFVSPMGDYAQAPVQEAYLHAAFFKGFTEGYNTMDALAALAFGIIIVQNIKEQGIEEPRDIAYGTVKAGIVTVILMSSIYTFLAIMGATSLRIMEPAENGGIALAKIANHFFGDLGSVLLAIIVTLACLKTAIGLIVACSETFRQIFPRSLSYKSYVILFTAFSCIVSNIGLTQLITLSIPVLMFIYPLAIALIILTLGSHLFKGRRCVYLSATIFTMLVSLADGLNAMPEGLRNSAPVSQILAFYEAHVPFFTLGMGWVIPMLAGTLVGLVIAVFYKDERKKTAIG
ncbi:branched-chain amino acid transport system II carrier protein [Aminipila butyrica]|uniref:Branched-chain amino acid transport system carrier protein n=1 Tax=Aminipila butyrica TaxID=433296 RepID=A0A858BYB3_9FIRM|nr:branched-chain amino acid transport system II carrier protein [Aminipila butyrica]QIB69694.1 branched-chain amino acid transport system II carrier protein [Aminipila butyrica]